MITVIEESYSNEMSNFRSRLSTKSTRVGGLLKPLYVVVAIEAIISHLQEDPVLRVKTGCFLN